MTKFALSSFDPRQEVGPKWIKTCFCLINSQVYNTNSLNKHFSEIKSHLWCWFGFCSTFMANLACTIIKLKQFVWKFPNRSSNCMHFRSYRYHQSSDEVFEMCKLKRFPYKMCDCLSDQRGTRKEKRELSWFSERF